jgi:peptidoglycan/LPS O-acetylase OafA/YrhL
LAHLHNKLKIENGNLLFLDGLRGLAALYVMVGHARWLLWEGYSEGFQKHPENYTVMNKALVYFFSLFKYGHEAVLFFFVLSGFVIHLRYARRMAEQGMAAKFDWGAFVWRRARRLYPPLLAAIVLAFILDSIGKANGFSIYHQGTPYPVVNANVVSHLDGITLLGNLAFLMNTYVPVFGCNGPLWSLKFEWWFYMIYPLFLSAVLAFEPPFHRHGDGFDDRAICGKFFSIRLAAAIAARRVFHDAGMVVWGAAGGHFCRTA